MGYFNLTSIPICRNCDFMQSTLLANMSNRALIHVLGLAAELRITPQDAVNLMIKTVAEAKAQVNEKPIKPRTPKKSA